MKLTEKYEEAFSHLPEGVEAAEAEAERSAMLSVTLENGSHGSAGASDVTDLYVRASGEKTGCTVTQDLEADSAKVILEALENGKYSQNAKPEKMLPGEKQQSTAEDELMDCLPPDRLWQAAEEIDRELCRRCPELSVRQLAVSDRITGIRVANSLGLCRADEYRRACLEVFAMDQRYPGRYFMQTYTAHDLFTLSGQKVAGDVEKWTEFVSEPVTSVPSGHYTCVLDGRVMANILLTSWQMFTAGNYLAEKTPFAGRMGQKTAASCVCLTDKVSRGGSGYRFAMDCEGNAGADVPVITEGVFRGLLSDGRGSVPGSGNAGRRPLLGKNGDVTETPKNFGLEPGDSSTQELLRMMGDGIYVWDSLDVFHTINIASGEYSIPCEGILIQDGKMAGALHKLTISGSVQNLLQNITAVGSEEFFCEMPILYSYNVSSPAVLLKDIAVSC